MHNKLVVATMLFGSMLGCTDAGHSPRTDGRARGVAPAAPTCEEQTCDQTDGVNPQGTDLEGGAFLGPGGQALIFDPGQIAVATGLDALTLTRSTLHGYAGGAELDLTGIVLPSVFPGHSITIVQISPHTNRFAPRAAETPFGESEYHVLCDGSPDACGAGPDPIAVPIAGVWSQSGAHMPDPGGRFEFFFLRPGNSAGTSVVVKCIDWGYKPWLRFGSSPDGFDAHQTCTRMARADYCADGQSHTVNDTMVNFYDIINRNIESPGHPGFFFEAAWRPGDQGHSAAICLSKLRWSTIPLGGPCANVLPDPRRDQTARFCEGYSPADLLAAGVLIYNKSAFIDLGLFHWQDGTGLHYTNSHYRDFGISVGDTTVPPGGYSPPAGFEGAAFNPNLTEGILPAGLLSLYSYQNPNTPFDYVTTVDGNAPPGYQVVALEGMIYPPAPALPAPARGLVRYAHPAGTFVTTTGAPPPGYAFDRLEGFLPR